METKLEKTPGNRNSVKITFEKTSCYFCNEWLESQTFKEHIIHCGQVLEKCPQSCSAYIQRKRLRLHLKECPKTKPTESKTEPSTSNNDNGNKLTTKDEQENRDNDNRMVVLEQDVSSLRIVLNEEIKQRLHLITDVGSLRKHNQISQEWTEKVGNILATIKKCINEESSARCNEMARLYDDLSKLKFQHQIDMDWQSMVTNRLETVQKHITNDENFRSNMISLVQDNKILAGKKELTFNEDLQLLQKQINELSNDTNKIYNHISENIVQLEQMIGDRESETNIKIKFLEETLQNIGQDLNTKFVNNTDLTAKQLTLDYEVKSMKNIVCETEEKCEKLEKLIENCERAIHETHQGLADLEGHLLYQKKLNAIQNNKGHLIWKITEFSKKLDECRKFDSPIQGPIFCNRPYGYTFRLHVYLNGLGTWKGRNIIASLNVIPGEFDTLLSWPCKLQADIILKDQVISSNRQQIYMPEDYGRTTIVKGRNDEYHSNLYIHIPHKIVESRNYLKNDSIYLEVRIRNSNRPTY